MKNKIKILIIEDDEEISEFMSTELGFEGYETFVSHDGIEGLSQARKIAPDLILLDRMLPNMNGIDICKRIKQTSDIPIIILTALGESYNKVEGFDAGANDYLVKPFNLDEFLARVKNQLRVKIKSERTRFELEDLSLDTLTREVIRNNRNIDLSPKEFDLLSFLIQNPRQVFTREKITEKVWGWNFESETNIVDVCIHGLREKIDLAGLPKLIQTIRGVGYTLRESK